MGIIKEAIRAEELGIPIREFMEDWFSRHPAGETSLQEDDWRSRSWQGRIARCRQQEGSSLFMGTAPRLPALSRADDLKEFRSDDGVAPRLTEDERVAFVRRMSQERPAWEPGDTPPTLSFTESDTFDALTTTGMGPTWRERMAACRSF